MAERLGCWPDVGTDGFAIIQEGGGWLVSMAPAPPLDLFVALDQNGDALLADTAAALSQADLLSSGLSPDALADRYNGSLRLNGLRTVHDGVFRVLGAHELRINSGRLHWRRWWEPSKIAVVRPASTLRTAERLRSLSEEVVRRHVPAAGPVAVQLSGGRDSSLLCALVAKQLAATGRKVHAMTALPCAGLEVSDERYQFDESAGAIATAARYGNVEHHLLRPEPVRFATVLDGLHDRIGEPIHQPVSLSWSWPQLARCSGLQIGVLLTGDNGNFTVSAGGLPSLSDVWRDEGPLRWLRTAMRLTREGDVSVRDIVRVSFGAALPLSVYQAARKRGQPALLFNDYPFFKGNLREKLLALTPDNDDPRPTASDRAFVRETAANICSLIPVGRFSFGVEMLAPWQDRALFELMLSLPSSLLASAPDRRLLFDEAFGDLLPREILRPARRGRQNVDFHASIDRHDLKAAAERYRQSPLCRGMIDLDRLADAAGKWPTERNTDVRHVAFWIGQFLPALSLASFLYTRDHPGSGASATRVEPLHAAP